MIGEREPESVAESNPRPTILIVEDEILVRMAIALQLRDAGYIVIEAADADEALRLVETSDAIDLVFSDVNMPGQMDGEALGRWLRHNRPHIKLLLTSGAGWPGVVPDRIATIEKPYRFSDLERRIRELLAS